jgi:hypothetical protein
MIEKREFGFASFGGWMLRHKGFKNKEELTAFLQDSVSHEVKRAMPLLFQNALLTFRKFFKRL